MFEAGKDGVAPNTIVSELELELMRM